MAGRPVYCPGEERAPGHHQVVAHNHVPLPGPFPTRLGREGHTAAKLYVGRCTPTKPPSIEPPQKPMSPKPPPQPLALLARYQPGAGTSSSSHALVLRTSGWGGVASGLQQRRSRRYAPRRRSQACERWCVTSQIQECN